VLGLGWVQTLVTLWVDFDYRAERAFDSALRWLNFSLPTFPAVSRWRCDNAFACQMTIASSFISRTRRLTGGRPGTR